MVLFTGILSLNRKWCYWAEVHAMCIGGRGGCGSMYVHVSQNLFLIEMAAIFLYFRCPLDLNPTSLRGAGHPPPVLIDENLHGRLCVLQDLQPEMLGSFTSPTARRC